TPGTVKLWESPGRAGGLPGLNYDPGIQYEPRPDACRSCVCHHTRYRGTPPKITRRVLHPLNVARGDPQANAEASSLTLCPRSGTSEAPDSPPRAPPTAESAHNTPDALPGRWGISSARPPPMDQPPWPPRSAPVGCQTRTAAAETTAARHQPATAVAPRTPWRDSSRIRLAAHRAGYTP